MLAENLRYVHGKQYWLTYRDGSRILVTANEDKYGEFDLQNSELSFGIWSEHAGPGKDYQVEEYSYEKYPCCKETIRYEVGILEEAFPRASKAQQNRMKFAIGYLKASIGDFSE